LPQWIKRWQEANKETEVEERLKDKARSGRKPTITADQWCKIMALACEKPENHGIPITHWNHSTLTAEIIKQGIVETISMSHVGDFLKKQNYNLIEASIG
jgi:putative transposase